MLTDELKATRNLAATEPQFAVNAARLANGLYALRSVLAALAVQLPSASLLALVRGTRGGSPVRPYQDYG